MAHNTQFYSQADCSVIINGRVAEDFYEGTDSIQVTPDGEQVTRTKGLGGAKLSFASYLTGNILLRFKPTSPTCQYLDDLVNNQGTSPALFDLTVTTGTKDVVQLKGCGVNLGAHNTGGETMQPKEYTFIGSELKMAQ